MAANILTVLKKYGFPEFRDVDGRVSIADLHRPTNRCGIYILKFVNNEYYIGQAVNVVRRFGQHRHNHADIVGLSFIEIRCEDLTPVERDAIGRAESAGIFLRNIACMSDPQVDSDLDEVIPAEEQESWLAELKPADVAGERVRDEGLRQRYQHRYKSFEKLPYAEDCVSVLRQYVHSCVPHPLRTELTFWACTAKPSGSNSKVRSYSCVNVNWQEVSQIYEDNGAFVVTFHLAKSPILAKYGSLANFERVYPWLTAWDHQYEPGGADQAAVIINGAIDAVRFLGDPVMVGAIRLLNLRLMRKGPTTFGRYHCFALADRLFETVASNNDHEVLDNGAFFRNCHGFMK